MAETIPIRTLRDQGRTAPGKAALPPAPKHLSVRARRIWVDVTREWVIGPEARPLLRCALEQMDQYDRALDQLRREGATVTHPQTGAIRQHPAHGVARDALREFRQCFRQLGLAPPQT